MKKISYLIILLCLILPLFACKKNPNIIYFNDDNISNFIDLFYKEINENSLYVAYDLRTRDEYLDEHLKQFQNNNNDLLNVISNNTTSKYDVYIFTSSALDIDFSNIDVQNIYILTTTYEKLKEYGKTYFVFDKGEYDCGC